MEELIIQNKNDLLQIIYLNNNKIVEYHELSGDKGSIVGNIYLRKNKKSFAKAKYHFCRHWQREDGLFRTKDIKPKV